MVVKRVIRTPLYGVPDPDTLTTVYVERHNLTIRMSMRRFTRLTNALSKKAENLQRALALNFMHYNFCRKHIAPHDACNRGRAHRIGFGRCTTLRSCPTCWTIR